MEPPYTPPSARSSGWGGFSTPPSRSSGGSSSKADYTGDRFIPTRRGVNLAEQFALLPEGGSGGGGGSGGSGAERSGDGGAATTPRDDDPYNMLLRNELLGDNVAVTSRRGSGRHGARGGSAGGGSGGSLFQYRVSPARDAPASPFSLSPVEADPMLPAARRTQRKIPSVPYKVLDAPALQDDFYLHLVDWSSTNVLAVGLGACVYLWSACTSKVTKLCDLGQETVTSVCWAQRGTHLAVGTSVGEVQVWDAAKASLLRTMGGHLGRVGTLSWSGPSLSSGSRDRTICMRDVRSAPPFTSQLVGHKQEVCGLRWAHDGSQLASGGNDNKLFIWSPHGTSPLLRFSDHTAAVKALAWSPHQNGLLASGGGTADRCIRFWNTQTATALSALDTGSQVCNLCWSCTLNELVSSHGYSQNQIVVWRYSSMAKVATLSGHTMRVLYLALSPDGQTVVSGAGDETLRFWNVFPQARRTTGDEAAPFSRAYTVR
mmetsp:Transcript_21320/g.70456  ORF Transcript_21320/g.70456 Transcript_21320/m.70456 type:complete len:487 (+) Transcript_21320:68-1528(+)